MWCSIVKLFVLCYIIVFTHSEFNPNTPEFVQKRKKMLRMLKDDKCKLLKHDEDRPNEIIPADEECSDILLLLTSMPGAEPYDCAGAVIPMCRRVGYWRRWRCSVKYHHADKIYQPYLMLPMFFCLRKSKQVDQDYDEQVRQQNAFFGLPWFLNQNLAPLLKGQNPSEKLRVEEAPVAKPIGHVKNENSKISGNKAARTYDVHPPQVQILKPSNPVPGKPANGVSTSGSHLQPRV